MQVKNLVYIFLVRYAERKPDEALLSINTFQKDLSDSNPRIRALALRVMSSIRIHATVGPPPSLPAALPFRQDGIRWRLGAPRRPSLYNCTAYAFQQDLPES